MGDGLRFDVHSRGGTDVFFDGELGWVLIDRLIRCASSPISFTSNVDMGTFFHRRPT